MEGLGCLQGFRVVVSNVWQGVHTVARGLHRVSKYASDSFVCVCVFQVGRRGLLGVLRCRFEGLRILLV